jgi:hypothetical protein
LRSLQKKFLRLNTLSRPRHSLEVATADDDKPTNTPFLRALPGQRVDR